jgi:hypothetical protein
MHGVAHGARATQPTSQTQYTRWWCCRVMEESWRSRLRTMDSSTSSRSRYRRTIESAGPFLTSSFSDLVRVSYPYQIKESKQGDSSF